MRMEEVAQWMQAKLGNRRSVSSENKSQLEGREYFERRKLENLLAGLERNLVDPVDNGGKIVDLDQVRRSKIIQKESPDPKDIV